MPYEAAYTAICPALTVYVFALGLLASKIRALLYPGVKIQPPSQHSPISGPPGCLPRKPPFYQQMTNWHLPSCQLSTNSRSGRANGSSGADAPPSGRVAQIVCGAGLRPLAAGPGPWRPGPASTVRCHHVSAAKWSQLRPCAPPRASHPPREQPTGILARPATPQTAVRARCLGSPGRKCPRLVAKWPIPVGSVSTARYGRGMCAGRTACLTEISPAINIPASNHQAVRS